MVAHNLPQFDKRFVTNNSGVRVVNKEEIENYVCKFDEEYVLKILAVDFVVICQTTSALF